MHIFMKDRGVLPSENDVSLQVYLALQQAKTEKDSVITFEKGTYHFYADKAAEEVSCVSNHDNDGFKKIGFLLDGADGLTIDGGGAEFVFHGIMLPFSAKNACNITIKNLAIDFPESMYGAMKVLNIGDRYVDLEVLPGTRYEIIDERLHIVTEGGSYPLRSLMEIDPEVNDIAYESNDRVFGDWAKKLDIKAKALSENTVRLSCLAMDRQPKVGNCLLIGTGHRFAPGFFFDRSRDITLEDVTIYNCLGMGVLAQVTENITLRRLQVIPKAGRMISAYADGTHFVNCSGDIVLDGCRIKNQMDDPLNCHGIYGQIAEKINAKTLLVRLVHNQQLGVEIFKAGDRIEWIDHVSLLTEGTAVIDKADHFARNMFLLTFKEDVPETVDVLDGVENMEHCPNLYVKDSYFGNNRARGLLITTRGHVVVENNTFSTNGAAIKISGDSNYWFESGCVRDVTIQNNEFLDCNRCSWWGKAVIDIDPEIKEPDEKKGCYHKDIRILSNTFETFDDGIVWAKSVENLVFSGNTVKQTASFPKKGIITEKFTLIACKNAKIEE